MTTVTVSVHQAAERLEQLVTMAEAGDEIIISRDGKAIALLAGYVKPTGARRFGAMRGRFVIDDSFFEPLPDDELAAWEGLPS